MKAKWAIVFLAASAFGALCQPASAQVAGAQTIGVSVEQDQLIVEGWSAKKSLLGKAIYNDSGEKVGVLHDIIIAPDNAVSFAIVAAHQFLGVSQHDVAVPMSQLDYVSGKLVWPAPRATRSSRFRRSGIRRCAPFRSHARTSATIEAMTAPRACRASPWFRKASAPACLDKQGRVRLCD